MMPGSFAIAATLLIVPIRGNANPADDKRRAAELFAEGRDLSLAHDDAGACAKFEAANRLDPDQVGTMLNLGVCHRALSHFKTALHWFRAAEGRARAMDLTDSELAAHRYAEEIADLVPSVAIELAPATGVDVALDGQAIDPGDHARTELDPGNHEIDATASGYVPYHASFRLKPGEQRALTIALVARSHKVIEPPSDGRRTAVYVGVAGLVVLAAGATVGIYAKLEYDKCVVNDRPLPRCTDSDMTGVAGSRRYTNMERWFATPLAGAGVITLGVATYLYLSTPSWRRADQVQWMPRIERDQLGLVARLTF